MKTEAKKLSYVFFGVPLTAATFLERPNRFLVVARLSNGEVVRAHCPDPGRLREILRPGTTLYVSPGNRPHGRTTHDLRLARHPEAGVLVSVDSRMANRLFAASLEAGSLEPFQNLIQVEREVPLPVTGGRVRSRADFRLTLADGAVWWVEVKSVTLVRNGTALFPDAVTERGRRHVLELADLAEKGAKTAVCFIVQRPDADRVMPEWDRDPAFGWALVRAEEAGVHLDAWTADVSLQGIWLKRRIPVVTRQPGHNGS